METIDTGTLTASGAIILWGVLQSFGLEYLWFVKDWFAKLDEGKKKTVNMVGILIITALAYGLSYAGVINAFAPDLNGLVAAIAVFFGALGINQGVHAGTKRT